MAGMAWVVETCDLLFGVTGAYREHGWMENEL